MQAVWVSLMDLDDGVTVPLLQPSISSEVCTCSKAGLGSSTFVRCGSRTRSSAALILYL